MKNLKKIFVASVACATVFALVGCQTKTSNDTVKKDEPEIIDTDDNQIANPWSTVETIKEASAIVGFDFNVPESIDGKDISLIQVMDDEEIEVRYGEDIIIRKSKGSDDNSGDYNNYDSVIEENGVTLKGDGDSYNCIIWTNEAYAYSITSSNGLGLDLVNELVSSID